VRNWLYLIFITFIPGIELRGAIPMGILKFKLNPVTVFLIIVSFNILIIPIVFLFWDALLLIAKKIAFVNIYLEKLDRRSRNVVKRFGFIGLMLFVAIPLPGTGAYSGAFVAELFDMDKRKAFFAIALGVLIAGIIVTLSVEGLLTFIKWNI